MSGLGNSHVLFGKVQRQPFLTVRCRADIHHDVVPKYGRGYRRYDSFKRSPAFQQTVLGAPNRMIKTRVMTIPRLGW